MRRLLQAVVGAFGLAGGPALAEPPVTIAVDCPAFEPESRAALEARSRAELLVQNASGTFVVACREGAASLTWHPLDGAPASSSVPLDDDPKVTIDHVLEALDEMLVVPAAGANSAAGTNGVNGPAAAAPTSVSVTTTAPAPVTAAPPPPAPPMLAGPSPGFLQPLPERRATWPGLLLGAGAAMELWSNTATLGPRARVLLPLPARFEAGVSGTLLFSLLSPDGVSGRLLRAAIGGDYAVDAGQRFRVGAEGFVDLLHANAGSIGSDDKTVFGALLRASAALVTHPVRVEVGPSLAIHPTSLQARLSSDPTGVVGTTAFDLHHFTVGFFLDATAGPTK